MKAARSMPVLMAQFQHEEAAFPAFAGHFPLNSKKCKPLQTNALRHHRCGSFGGFTRIIRRSATYYI